MVHLPSQFVSTRYPGYFWNMEDQRLYSLKVDGILKPLKLTRPNRWNEHFLKMPAYRISVEGQRRYMYEHDLKNLTYKDTDRDSWIPVKEKK